MMGIMLTCGNNDQKKSEIVIKYAVHCTVVANVVESSKNDNAKTFCVTLWKHLV